MLMKKFFALLAVAYTSVLVVPAAAADGAFYLSGSALLEIRRQIDALPVAKSSVSVAATGLQFTYDPSAETITTSKAATRMGIVALTKDPQSELTQKPPVTISGTVALAILSAIAIRPKPIRPSLVEREKHGQFSITGYDSGSSVVFNEYFATPRYFATLHNPLRLESCITHVGYFVSEPSYEVTNMEIRYCEGDS